MQQTTEQRPRQEPLETITLSNGAERQPVAVDGEEISPCPNCGAAMNGIRGSKSAVCHNCGFKDSCCF